MSLYSRYKNNSTSEIVEKTPEEIQAENERRRKLELMPASTTDSIEGYNISGSRIILSTTVTVNTGYLPIKSFEAENEIAKNKAMLKLKESALEKNCNAVIGLRFEFNNFVADGKVHTYLSAYATGIKIVGKI